MTYKVRITQKAWEEIDQAYEWLALRSPTAAASWKQSLLDATDTLAQLPHRCPLAPESAFFGTELRELHHGKRQRAYRIVFQIRENTVYVLRVRHSARRGLEEE